MSLNELKSNYARLRDEINALGGAAQCSEARLARLICELDQIDQDLTEFKRLAREAPTLRDVVSA